MIAENLGKDGPGGLKDFREWEGQKKSQFCWEYKIFKGSIVAGFRNMVPDGGTVTFYRLTCFVDSQVLSTASI